MGKWDNGGGGMKGVKRWRGCMEVYMEGGELSG